MGILGENKMEIDLRKVLKEDENNPYKEHDFELVNGKRKHKYPCKRCEWKEVLK